VPTGLAGTVVSATQINLSWTASTGATAYQVQRSTDNVNWATIGTPTGTTYASTGLAGGTRYYYRVLAGKMGSFSAPSASISRLTRPAAPTGLTATPLSATQIKLSWTASHGATSYQIQRSTNNSTWVLITTVTTTTLTNGGLATGFTYYYRIVAVDASGGSIPSAVASTTTFPAAPSGLAMSTRTSSQINLTWTADRGAVSYRLQRSTDNVNWTQIATPTGNAYSGAGLPAGQLYHYRLYAVGTTGVSNVSAVLTTATRPSATFTAGTAPITGSTAVYVFTVTYKSAAGINTGSINTGDISVTGPSSYSRTATFVSFIINADGSVSASYKVGAPTGGWQPGTTYTVALVASQVDDKNGIYALGGKIGTFAG
jgi:titin